MRHHNAQNSIFSKLAGQIDGQVHCDALRRYMLSTDASIFRKMPAAVVYPGTTADVQAVVRFAADHNLSLHPRGAGSGLCGSALGDGMVVDFSKYMNRLICLDPANAEFECQPGYRLGELEAALADRNLFFPPDPSSGEYATFGGMCSTNASGAHSVKYGNVADYLIDAQVVLSDGSMGWLSQWEATPIEDLPANLRQLARLYEVHAQTIESAYPPIACNVAGYNLRGLLRAGRLHLHRLFAGAEGTLGMVTRLKFRLLPKPAANALVIAYFDCIAQAARAVQLTMPLKPAGIEVMDKSLLQLAGSSDPALKGRIPAGVDNVLLIAFDGASPQDCATPAAELQGELKAHGLTNQVCLAATTEEQDAFRAVRKAAVPILYKLKGPKKILALVEDAAVPVDQLASYFEGIYAIFKRHGVDFVLYGHIAKGLMHTRPLLDLKSAHDVELLKPIADDVFNLVDGLDGTVSGEHGDGRLRSAYLQRKYPTIYGLFEKTKKLLDPLQMFNPEIKHVTDAMQMARHLRFGTTYRTHPVEDLNLEWPETIEGEAEKCHGCSKCTTVTEATRMCPVYKATRDEAAAPKAKANVLRALISGAVGRRAIYQRSLQQVMAQCVNCGSCFRECPSNVNIPKLAMEAKAHYVRRYGAAWVDRVTAHVEAAARASHRLTPLIAPVMQLQGVRHLAARMTGLAAEREMVLFARRSLYQRHSEITPGGGPRVLFYAGCYAGYIRPELGTAAIEVLAHMDFHIHLGRQHCCGLPQLSKGMTAGARRKVRQNLQAWKGLIDTVDHIVVTCSSCGYALMKDWAYLASDLKMARKVASKTIHISRLLNQYRDRLVLGDVPLKLAYHQPCHLRIQDDGNSSMTLLANIPGSELHDLNGPCCGMAGSWGLIAGHYELSTTIGAPMIETLKACGAQLGVTDCPTCQMQMEHLGRLPVKHPVEIVRQAI